MYIYTISLVCVIDTFLIEKAIKQFYLYSESFYYYLIDYLLHIPIPHFALVCTVFHVSL
jgi:hypothetical protein